MARTEEQTTTQSGGSTRKTYLTPELVTLGTVEKITRGKVRNASDNLSGQSA